jgi:pilus assembly protein CpaB
VLRRSKTITLPDDDELMDREPQRDEQPVLPQEPSINEPLLLDRRIGGVDRRSQDEVRTEFQRTLAFAQEHGTLPRPATPGNFGTKLRIGLVAIALLAGGGAAWLATRAPSPAPEAIVAPVVAAPVIPTVKVLVATKAIGLGERLSTSVVAWQDWPQATVQSSYITDAATPDALTNASGNVARSEFVAGEPILDSKLVKTNEGFLSAVLAPGMRGVSVSVTADAASGGFIVPNDHVDVVMSRMSDTVQQSQTILTDVRVLAINARLGQSGATGAPDATDPKSEIFQNAAIATLELNPTQSEIIVNATQAGKLSLVLRSLSDSTGSANAADTAANQAIRMTSPFWTK